MLLQLLQLLQEKLLAEKLLLLQQLPKMPALPLKSLKNKE